MFIITLGPCYIILHTLIFVIYSKVHVEEQLANLSALIERPVKMVRLEDTVSGERGPSPKVVGAVRGILCSFILISRAQL